jgi:hypothetical protein
MKFHEAIIASIPALYQGRLEMVFAGIAPHSYQKLKEADSARPSDNDGAG